MDSRGGAGSLRIALGHRAVARRIHETVQVLAPSDEESATAQRPRRRSSLEADTTFLEELVAQQDGEGGASGAAPPPQPPQPPAPASVPAQTHPTPWGIAPPIDLARGQSGDSVNSLATVVPEGASLPDSPSSSDEKENRGFTMEDASSGRENPMATHFPSPGASPERQVLSTLYEAPPQASVESAEHAEEEQAGDDASAMAVDPPQEEGQRTQAQNDRDIVEELLSTPDSALLADRILAQHLISHPAPLKRFDSADAAMEMAQRQQRRQQQQQQQQGHGTMELGLPPPPASTAPPAYPPNASPFCRFTVPPASGISTCLADWGTESSAEPGSSPLGFSGGQGTPSSTTGGGGMVEVPLDSPAPPANTLILPPHLEAPSIQPKYERFDSADYWMAEHKHRNYPSHATTDGAEPVSASDFKALEEKLRIHEHKGKLQIAAPGAGRPMAGLDQWMDVDTQLRVSKGGTSMVSSPATTNCSSSGSFSSGAESDGGDSPVSRAVPMQTHGSGSGQQAAAHFLLQRGGADRAIGGDRLT